MGTMMPKRRTLKNLKELKMSDDLKELNEKIGGIKVSIGEMGVHIENIKSSIKEIRDENVRVWKKFDDDAKGASNFNREIGENKAKIWGISFLISTVLGLVAIIVSYFSGK